MLSLLVAPQSAAFASSADPVGTIQVVTDGLPIDSVTAPETSGLTLEIPVSSGSNFASLSTDVAASLGGVLTDLQPYTSTVNVPIRGTSPGDVGSSGSPYPIRCSSGDYRFSDNNGDFTVRNNCGYKNFNWGYQISPGLRSIIAGDVNEGGMGWSLNGSGQGIATSHNEYSGYLFHGTWGGTYGRGYLNNNDVIQYEDHFYLRVNVNGRTGNGHLRIYGHLRVAN